MRTFIRSAPVSRPTPARSIDLKTPTEYVAAIKKYAAAHPAAPWITGGGWLMSAFGPGGAPRRQLIDAVVPERPVFLASSDGHTYWANSKALELAKITNQTPDPPDGRIDRDPKTGAAIGSLQEGAGDLVDRVVPPATAAEHEAGLRYAIKLLNGYGITAIQDAQVYEDDSKAYRAVDRRGDLSLRVVAAIWWEHSLGLEQIDTIKRLRAEYSSGRIDAGTVKIMLDGVMENYTAVVLKPYLKLPGEVRGIPMVKPDVLNDAVTRLDAAGFQVHFHAIGDGAVREALDAIEHARHAQRGPRPPPPHRAPRADRWRGPPALPGARSDREFPAAVGVRRRVHHESDGPVPRARALLASVSDRHAVPQRCGRRVRQRLVGLESPTRWRRSRSR